jgi:hypothetical protein
MEQVEKGKPRRNNLDEPIYKGIHYQTTTKREVLYFKKKQYGE